MEEVLLRVIDAGETLSDVVYLTIDELPRASVQLVFSSTTLFVSVDQDNDEIVMTDESPPNVESRQRVSQCEPWKSALGRRIVWVWRLQNHQGYMDGLQFEFSNDRHIGQTIQLIGMASSIWVRNVVGVDSV